MSAGVTGPSHAPATVRLSFWLLAALVWFATVGWRPLLEPDEGRYAEIPREMLVSGDWVTPRLNGVKYFEKPALQYWATAAVYSVFGVTEWTSRFWACALAFLCIPMVYAFARRVYGSASVAGAAAAALAASPFFVLVGQINLLDSALSFFLVASMFSFLLAGRAVPGSSEEQRWMLLTWLALALASLSKGPVALVLAGATLVAHMGVTREVRPLSRWHLAWGLPLFLVVAAPWFILVSLRNPEFPHFFFVHEHFARFLTSEADRVQPWWFFLPMVLLGVLPWLRYLMPALRPVQGDGGDSIRWFLLIWCAVVLVFFSASHSKLAPYVMPMMPPLAVLLAPRIARNPASFRHAAWIVCAFTAVVGVGLVAYAARKPQPVPREMLVWSALAVATGVAAALLARLTSRRQLTGAWLWAPTGLGAILAFQALMMSYSALPPVRTAKALVERIRPLVGTDTELFSVDQYRQSVPPYLGRTLRLVAYTGEMELGLGRESAGFLPTLDAFAEVWTHSSDALAFVNPDVMDELQARRVPFRIRASDGRSIVVTRQ